MQVNLKNKFIFPARIFSFFLAFIWCIISNANVGGQEKLWDKANQFYSQKQYDSALLYYSQLESEASNSAQIHYNLGNSYFRLNKVGNAVLHYEKALHLDPGNEQAKENLMLAKARILNPVPEIAPIFFVSWWESLLHAFSPNIWAWVTFLVAVAILGLIYLLRTRKGAFAHSGRWLSVALVVFFLCGCMAYFTYDAALDSGRVVVLEQSAPLLDDPKESGKVLFNLPAGTILDIYAYNREYINVKLPNGRVGWVKIQSVGKV